MSTVKKAQTTKGVHLRLTPAVIAKLKREAVSNHRTISAQAEVLIRRGLINESTG